LPSAASSSARVLLASDAFSPLRLSVRLGGAPDIDLGYHAGIAGLRSRNDIEQVCDPVARRCVLRQTRILRSTPKIEWLGTLPVKVVGYMAALLTPEDVVRRIAAECAYVNERGGVGIRL
jgi:hypothetical protein